MNFITRGVNLNSATPLHFDPSSAKQVVGSLKPHRRIRPRWRGPDDIEATRFRRVRLEKLPSHARI
jgi:hypothetical protein